MKKTLAPRHEAPFFIKDGEDPAEFRALGKRMADTDHEAPAEGAGEREAIARTLWISRGGINRLFDEGSEWKNGNGFEQRQQCLVDADAILALRARSSAPEAREGEAGWKYEVFGPEGRSRSVRSVIGPKPNVAAPVGGYVLYDALYTHSAAPNADKLREVVQNFIRWAENPADDACGMAREQEWLQQARQALANQGPDQ